MATDTDDTTVAHQPEPPSNYFLGAFEWTAEFTKFRKYLRTRQAVMNGVPLFARSSVDLKRDDLMGPLTFNVYETALAALPTQLTLAVVWFLWGEADSSSPLTPTAALPNDDYSIGMSVLLPKLQALVTPLVVPSTALAIGWIAALLSLARRDWARQKIRRARDAFLYYDGAHGLVPECGLALLFTAAPMLSAGLFQLGFIPLSLFAYVAARKTEDELASANGYWSGPFERTSIYATEAQSPIFPTRRYRVGMALLVLPVTLVVLVALSVSAYVGAAALSAIRASVRLIVSP